MAENRKKTGSILLSLQGKTGEKEITSIELFPGEEWGDQPGGAFLHRIRINGKWFSPDGSKYCFLTVERVGQLVAEILAGCTFEDPEPVPDFPVRSIVSVPTTYDDGLPFSREQGCVHAPPHIGADGRWWVWCAGAYGLILFPCEDVIMRRRCDRG